jgi:hypothetical protein
MKRSHLVQLMHPEGSIVKFVGDEWRVDLRESLGIVIAHNTHLPGDEATMDVMCNGSVVSVIYDEFQDHELVQA